MSREEANIAVVLRSFETFAPGTLHGEWANFWHPDASTTAAPDWPEPGPFEGRDAIVTQFERLFADWSEYRLEDVEIRFTVGDWVIATWAMWARGLGSGLEMRLE
ncbi:MAG: ketosteroid isomerase family protein, partial [Actinomycetota bacterium]|nr:ketosteroid isomerase family protein [Actinomycetota bacterium]